MESCIFCKIRDKIIPKEFMYEDKDLMVFPDITPRKPIHLLFIPKKHIKDLIMINDKGLMMKITKIIQKMIKKFELEDKGYRVLINGGGAQFVDHLHIHLLGPVGKKSLEF
jgi:histidine triad (HIT) family protein